MSLMGKINRKLLLETIVLVLVVVIVVIASLIISKNTKNKATADLVKVENEFTEIDMTANQETNSDEESLSENETSSADETDSEKTETYTLEQLREMFNHDLIYIESSFDSNSDCNRIGYLNGKMIDPFDFNPDNDSEEDFKVVVELYRSGNLISKFEDPCKRRAYDYEVIETGRLLDDILLVLGGIASYCDLGFIEDQKFHRIVEFSYDDCDDLRVQGYKVFDYEILLADDEIRVVYYVYDPKNPEDVQVKGYKCKLQKDPETEKHYFDVEKM